MCASTLICLSLSRVTLRHVQVHAKMQISNVWIIDYRDKSITVLNACRTAAVQRLTGGVNGAIEPRRVASREIRIDQT
jgi:hypothetical protein